MEEVRLPGAFRARPLPVARGRDEAATALHRPAELLGHAVDGDVEDAADEEMLAADYAEIFGQEIAVRA